MTERNKEYQREWARRKRKSMSPEEKERTKEIRKRSYQKNKEKRLLGAREWKAKNADRVKMSRATYYAEHSEKEKQDNKIWIAANPDRYKEIARTSNRQYYEENKAIIIEKQKNYVAVNAEIIKVKRKVYRKNPQNKLRRNKQQRQRYRNDAEFRLLVCLRNRLNIAFREAMCEKSGSARALLGIDIPEFRRYMESLFTDGMSWERISEIHVDHIIPCCAFDLKNKEQVAQCFHYTNLQPLWAVDNLKKGRTNPANLCTKTQ